MCHMRLKHGNDRINFLRYICHIYFNEAIQTNYKHYIHVHNCAYNTFLRYILNSRTVFIFTTLLHMLKQDEDFVILENEHSYSPIADERVLIVLK